MTQAESIETDVLKYWKASLAWKGDHTFIGLNTYGELLQQLTPLAEHPIQSLATQADELAMQVIHAKRRRKKIKCLGKQKVTRLKLVTNNSGLKNNKAQTGAAA